jgi:hypothetical protein
MPGRLVKGVTDHEMLLQAAETVDRRGQNHESLALGTGFNHDKTHSRTNPMKRTILLAACLALTLGGCAEMETKPAAAAPATPATATATATTTTTTTTTTAATATAAASTELDQTIAYAEKEIAAAKKVGIWRDTEKFLEDAKQAKAEGKNDEAMKLAKKALKQAQLAQQQSASQVDAKPVYPN